MSNQLVSIQRVSQPAADRVVAAGPAFERVSAAVAVPAPVPPTREAVVAGIIADAATRPGDYLADFVAPHGGE